MLNSRTPGEKRRKVMVPKYPNVRVRLSHRDGNAFAIMGAVDKALKKAGCPEAERDTFLDEARSGDYDHLLKVCMLWVQVD